jgi:hypothetical protein
MFRQLKSQIDTYINYPMAIAGAVVLGGIVFYINASHGPLLATVAASKQAAYTFFAGGFIARFGEVLAIKWRSRWRSLVIAIIAPTVVAVGLTFLVHSLRGTPEPMQSTLPTLILSPIGFFLIGWRRQRKFFAAQLE